MGSHPYDFIVKEFYWGVLPPLGGPRGASIHRTFFEADLAYFCRGLEACYRRFGTLEELFFSAGRDPARYNLVDDGSPGVNSENFIWNGINLFRETMASGNGGLYSKHIANPEENSACKRLNLALRWLVRSEGPVDLGVWKGISPSKLFIPLDVHVGRSARILGLLDSGRKANDKKTVTALTAKLREFCPEDPVKYDLALFGYGVGSRI